MNFRLFIALLFGIQSLSYSQDSDESQNNGSIPKELGIDLNLSASNFGGTAGLGVKFGFVKNEKYVFGPSIRFQRTWAKYVDTDLSTGYSIFGGGAFAHVRLYDYFFVGTEIELLSTPFIIGNTFTGKSRTLVPIVLVGGGFSRAFSPRFRLNAGIMYDVINNVNSPLRQGYFIRKKTPDPNVQGALIPLVYRIAFFFTL